MEKYEIERYTIKEFRALIAVMQDAGIYDWDDDIDGNLEKLEKLINEGYLSILRPGEGCRGTDTYIDYWSAMYGGRDILLNMKTGEETADAKEIEDFMNKYVN